MMLQTLDLKKWWGELSGLPYCANWDGDPSRSIRRCQHVAAAVKNSTWVNHHARVVNISRHNPFYLQLNLTLGENHTSKWSRYHHPVSFYVTSQFVPVA